MITEFIHTYEACVGRLPSGHRVWRCQTTDGVHYAIADNSGMLPHLTDDDGPLFLDCSRTLKTGTFHAIPVFDELGQKWSVPGDAPTILFLSKFMNWTIEDTTNQLFYNIAGAESDQQQVPVQTNTTWSYPYERTN